MVGTESKVPVGCDEGTDDPSLVKTFKALEEWVVVKFDGPEIFNVPAPVAS